MSVPSALPAWSGRISARYAISGEIILRVPGYDEFGWPMPTDHVIEPNLALRLVVELSQAIELSKSTPATEVRP